MATLQCGGCRANCKQSRKKKKKSTVDDDTSRTRIVSGKSMVLPGTVTSSGRPWKADGSCFCFVFFWCGRSVGDGTEAPASSLTSPDAATRLANNRSHSADSVFTIVIRLPREPSLDAAASIRMMPVPGRAASTRCALSIDTLLDVRYRYLTLVTLNLRLGIDLETELEGRSVLSA